MAYKALTASRGSWQTGRIWRKDQCGVTGTVTICQHVSSWVWFITGEENHPGIVPAVPAACCAPLSTVCHDSCASCSGPAASHCVACIRPHVLLQGHCLPSCGEGFYPNRGVCEGTVGTTVFLLHSHKNVGWFPTPKYCLPVQPFLSCILNGYEHIRACAISLCCLLVPQSKIQPLADQKYKVEISEIFPKQSFNPLHVHDMCGCRVKYLPNLRSDIYVDSCRLYANARPIYKGDFDTCGNPKIQSSGGHSG